MYYIPTLCYLLKIQANIENCCVKPNNERIKNDKKIALQVILVKKGFFMDFA